MRTIFLVLFLSCFSFAQQTQKVAYTECAYSTQRSEYLIPEYYYIYSGGNTYTHGFILDTGYTQFPNDPDDNVFLFWDVYNWNFSYIPCGIQTCCRGVATIPLAQMIYDDVINVWFFSFQSPQVPHGIELYWQVYVDPGSPIFTTFERPYFLCGNGCSYPVFSTSALKVTY